MHTAANGPDIDIAAELVRVVESVTAMCDHLVASLAVDRAEQRALLEADRAEQRALLEADRAERMIMIEALTKMVEALPAAITPASAPAPALPPQPRASERIVGGSVDAGPDPVIDLREAHQVREVRCRIGDEWVDGLEICGMVDDEAGVRYRVRRRVDGLAFAELVDAADIRYITPDTADDESSSRWSPL